MEYIRKKYNAFVAYYYWYKKLKNCGLKTAYLVGTPTHVNIGDSAITLAEIRFLKLARI